MSAEAIPAMAIVAAELASNPFIKLEIIIYSCIVVIGAVKAPVSLVVLFPNSGG